MLVEQCYTDISKIINRCHRNKLNSLGTTYDDLRQDVLCYIHGLQRGRSAYDPSRGPLGAYLSTVIGHYIGRRTKRVRAARYVPTRDHTSTTRYILPTNKDPDAGSSKDDRADITKPDEDIAYTDMYIMIEKFCEHFDVNVYNALCDYVVNDRDISWITEEYSLSNKQFTVLLAAFEKWINNS